MPHFILLHFLDSAILNVCTPVSSLLSLVLVEKNCSEIALSSSPKIYASKMANN